MTSVQPQRHERVYLHVPFKEKDDAKAQGAFWDAAARKWYVPPGRSLWSFVRWLPPEEKSAFEAEKRREDEYRQRAREWEQLEPRWTDPAIILSKLPRQPAKRTAFCGMCDSHCQSTWFTSDSPHSYELRHLAEMGGQFRRSEMILLERALEGGLLTQTKRRRFSWPWRSQK